MQNSLCECPGLHAAAGRSSFPLLVAGMRRQLSLPTQLTSRVCTNTSVPRLPGAYLKWAACVSPELKKMHLWLNHPIMWAPGAPQTHFLEEHLAIWEALSRVHITCLPFFTFWSFLNPLCRLFLCFLCMCIHCSLPSATFLASTLPILYSRLAHVPPLSNSSLQCSCSLHESCWKGKKKVSEIVP